jgi:hypothetical protein
MVGRRSRYQLVSENDTVGWKYEDARRHQYTFDQCGEGRYSTRFDTLRTNKRFFSSIHENDGEDAKGLSARLRDNPYRRISEFGWEQKRNDGSEDELSDPRNLIKRRKSYHNSDTCLTTNTIRHSTEPQSAHHISRVSEPEQVEQQQLKIFQNHPEPTTTTTRLLSSQEKKDDDKQLDDRMTTPEEQAQAILQSQPSDSRTSITSITKTSPTTPPPPPPPTTTSTKCTATPSENKDDPLSRIADLEHQVRRLMMMRPQVTTESGGQSTKETEEEKLLLRERVQGLERRLQFMQSTLMDLVVVTTDFAKRLDEYQKCDAVVAALSGVASAGSSAGGGVGGGMVGFSELVERVVEIGREKIIQQPK